MDTQQTIGKLNRHGRRSEAAFARGAEARRKKEIISKQQSLRADATRQKVANKVARAKKRSGDRLALRKMIGAKEGVNPRRVILNGEGSQYNIKK